MRTRYDFLIVGAGFFGSTFARTVTDAGKRCLVIDKNPHLAGAAYDKIEEGIPVCQYGAHIFHTKDVRVWNFVRQFGEFNSYVNKPKAVSDDGIYSFPLNMMTFHQLWGVKTPDEAERKLEETRVKIERPSNAEEWLLSIVGVEIYEKFFYGYTKKQWHREPRELPASIVRRLPIRLTWEENYFSTEHQGMPIAGFTDLSAKLLDGIDVELGVDFFDLAWKDLADRLIYTGPIDQFFGYEYGKLDYNTLRFEKRVFTGDHQGTAVLNYVSENVPYLRSVEHRHFYELSHLKKHWEPGKKDERKTVVTYDYPVKFEEHPEPYYPIRDERNSQLYARYAAITPADVTFGGRLGEYKYLDIDQTIASAIQKAKKLLETP